MAKYVNRERIKQWVYIRRNYKGFYCRCGARTEGFPAMLEHVRGLH